MLIFKYFFDTLVLMDKKTQSENIQKELTALKKDNNQLFENARNKAKEIKTKHSEIGTDRDLELVVVYAITKLGADKTVSIVDSHFKPRETGKFAKIMEGTKTDPQASLNFLYRKLTSTIERASLAHNVYVLAKTKIRNGVEFPGDEPDTDTDVKPTHDTMSVTLWDNDAKKIISLFLVDAQIEPHKSLEPDHAYKMQIGGFNEEKQRWYASKDPGVRPLDGNSFKLNWEELAEYVLTNYEHVTEPYDEVVAKGKLNRGQRFVMQAQYVKTPSYIEIIPFENANGQIVMTYSPITKELRDEGELVVVGSFAKPVPRNNQPALSDYIIFPDIVIDLNPGEASGKVGSGDEEETKKTSSNNAPKENNDDLGL